LKSKENTVGDNPPIGIVLGADKNDILVEYAIGGISNKIFVSKYQLYLPDRKVIEQKLLFQKISTPPIFHIPGRQYSLNCTIGKPYMRPAAKPAGSAFQRNTNG
jgi:hypothetical protein